MEWGFTWLYNWVNAFWGYVVSVGQWIIDGMVYAVKGGLWYVLEGLYTAILAAVSAINVGNLIVNSAATWGAMPGQVVWIMNEVQIGACLTLIAYATGVRMLLNLIPLVRI